MNEPIISRPIAEMLLAIERKAPYLWPMPIIDALEVECGGKALEFVSAFVDSQLCRFGCSETVSKRKQWLANLRARRAARASPQEIIRLSRDIWYYELCRDKAQTAISRLYEALSYFLGNHQIAYRRTLAVAIIIVASDESAEPSLTVLEKIIDLYHHTSDHTYAIHRPDSHLFYQRRRMMPHGFRIHGHLQARTG